MTLRENIKSTLRIIGAEVRALRSDVESLGGSDPEGSEATWDFSNPIGFFNVANSQVFMFNGTFFEPPIPVFRVAQTADHTYTITPDAGLDLNQEYGLMMYPRTGGGEGLFVIDSWDAPSFTYESDLEPGSGMIRLVDSNFYYEDSGASLGQDGGTLPEWIGMQVSAYETGYTSMVPLTITTSFVLREYVGERLVLREPKDSGEYLIKKTQNIQGSTVGLRYSPIQLDQIEGNNFLMKQGETIYAGVAQPARAINSAEQTNQVGSFSITAAGLEDAGQPSWMNPIDYLNDQVVHIQYYDWHGATLSVEVIWTGPDLGMKLLEVGGRDVILPLPEANDAQTASFLVEGLHDQESNTFNLHIRKPSWLTDPDARLDFVLYQLQNNIQVLYPG